MLTKKIDFMFKVSMILGFALIVLIMFTDKVKAETTINVVQEPKKVIYTDIPENGVKYNLYTIINFTNNTCIGICGEKRACFYGIDRSIMKIGDLIQSKENRYGEILQIRPYTKNGRYIGYTSLDYGFRDNSENATDICFCEKETYLTLLQVIDYDDGNSDKTFWVCFRDCNGNQYHFEMCSDFSIGDYFTAIVDNNGTVYVADDKIVSIKYERPDLF